MNKLYLKSLYIFLCSTLGALLFLIIQKSLVFIYFLLMNFDYKTFGFGITDNGLHTVGYVLTFVALFFGGWYGTWLGLHWYELVYGSGESRGLLYGLRNHTLRKFKTQEDEPDSVFDQLKKVKPILASPAQTEQVATELKPFEIDALKSDPEESVSVAEPENIVSEPVSSVEVAEPETPVEPETPIEVEAPEEVPAPVTQLKEIKVIAPKKVAPAPVEKNLPAFLEAALKEKPSTELKRNWDFDDLTKVPQQKEVSETTITADGSIENNSPTLESTRAELVQKVIQSATEFETEQQTVEVETVVENKRAPKTPLDDIGPFETVSEIVEELVEEIEKPKKTRAKKPAAKSASKKVAKKAPAKKPTASVKVSRIKHAKKAAVDGINSDGSTIGFSEKTVTTK